MVFEPGIFSDKQLEVMLESTAMVNLLVGAVRSGKTVSSLFALVFALPDYPSGNILLVGKSDKTLYRNIIRPLEEMFGAENVKFRRGTGEGELFGHYFFAAGANDERSVTKIQGLTLSLAYGDEVSTWPESFFNMLISRLSDHGAKFIGTLNPEGPYHWLKKNYIDREKELSLKVWTFYLEENENLPPEYVGNLKKFYVGLWYRRYIQAQWVLAEGAIYDMFLEEKHVADVTAEQWKHCFIKHVSVDYGTGNPTVFQMWGQDGYKRYLLKEYFYDSKIEGRQKTDSQYADDLIEFIGKETIQAIIVDPSAASFKVELETRGLPVENAVNDVLDGIRVVSSELERGIIQVDPSCINYIREKSGYVWDIKACSRGEDRPIKQSDHAQDAERYYIYTIPLIKPTAGFEKEDDYGFSYHTGAEEAAVYDDY